jgi:hypothetical protein
LRAKPFMSVRVPLLLAFMMAVLIAVPSAAVFGMHPSESPTIDPEFPTECTEELFGQIFEAPDGERWLCQYNPDLQEHLWDALPPKLPGQEADPDDGMAYQTVNFPTNDGRTYHTTARIEWINDVLYSGTDVDVRKPITSPLIVKANRIGVKTMVFSWDGTSWTKCRESGWNRNQVATDHLSKTHNWGFAPCDWRWYAAVSYVERYNAQKNRWVVLNGGYAVADTTEPGHVNLGSAQNGQVWDPAPGDEDKKTPQFPPDAKEKLKEKIKKEKPAPSAPEKSPPPADGSG